MSKLILSRRRFLYVAPAIIAASSLMPGHSVAQLLLSPVAPVDFVEVALKRWVRIVYDPATKLWKAEDVT